MAGRGVGMVGDGVCGSDLPRLFPNEKEPRHVICDARVVIVALSSLARSDPHVPRELGHSHRNSFPRARRRGCARVGGIFGSRGP